MLLKKLLVILNNYLEMWMTNLGKTEKEKNLKKYAKGMLICAHIFAYNTITIVIPLYGFVSFLISALNLPLVLILWDSSDFNSFCPGPSSS